MSWSKVPRQDGVRPHHLLRWCNAPVCALYQCDRDARTWQASVLSLDGTSATVATLSNRSEAQAKLECETMLTDIGAPVPGSHAWLKQLRQHNHERMRRNKDAGTSDPVRVA